MVLCNRREHLSYRTFLEQKQSKKQIKDSVARDSEMSFDVADGFTPRPPVLEPMQLEAELYELHLTSTVTYHYYGLSPRALAGRWQEWDGVHVHVAPDDMHLCALGCRESLDVVVKWRRLHRGHNEYSFNTDRLVPRPSGQLAVISLETAQLCV